MPSMVGDDVPQCPQEVRCDGNWSSFTLGPIPCFIGIASDVASSLGSIAIVLIYLKWKDLRRLGAQSIVTYLAVADFCTTFAYLAGSVNIVKFTGEKDVGKCALYSTICDIESYIVTWSTMSSYLWTTILAFYFCLSIVYNKPKLALRLMPLYHMIAWGIPMFFALPLLCFDKLAYSPYVAGIWCYINVPSKFYKPPFLGERTVVSVLVKLPEILGYILILALYTATRISIHKKVQKIQRQKRPQVGLKQLNSFLHFIPIAFILLRVWCTVQYFYSIHVAEAAHANNGCIPKPMKTGYVIIGVLQAIGGGGQGWTNTILYVFLSSELR